MKSVHCRAVAFNVSTWLPEGRRSENSGTEEVNLSCLAPRVCPCFKGFSSILRFFLLPNTLHLSIIHWPSLLPLVVICQNFQKKVLIIGDRHMKGISTWLTWHLPLIQSPLFSS